MGTFVYGAGSGYPGYWLGLHSARATESATKLAAGTRINGKSSAADQTAYDIQKLNASFTEIMARSTAYRASKASEDFARIDSAAQLVSRAAEGGVSAAEKAALEAQAQLILDDVTSITASVATVYDDLGEISGISAALERQSIAEAAAAGIQREAAEGFVSVDFANESAQLARYQVLQQAASAMVAQVNQSRALFLSLLK